MKNCRFYEISFARFIAMLFIIICHIFQQFNLELAWWFNVGVQMFLFISGFLYANKTINEIKLFYKKEILKIIVPYYIYLIFVTLFYLIFKNDYISFESVIKAIFMFEWYPGIGHLWFIPYILICYAILPILLSFYKADYSIKKLTFFTFCLMILIEIIFYIHTKELNGSFINCFILGIYFKKLLKIFSNKKFLFNTIFILSLTLNLFRVYIEYFRDFTLSKELLLVFSKYCNYTHMLLGFSLVLVLIYVYDKIKLKINIISILNFSDKYSFYIYFTHHIFILGYFSIFKYIKSFFGAIIIILILTIFTAYLLKKATNITINAINNRI